MTTPKTAVRQGLFDIIVERAATMTHRCMQPNPTGEASTVCGYDDGKGNACFAGMILPPGTATYSSGQAFIGGIRSLMREKQIQNKPLPDYIIENVKFIGDMQSIHDEQDYWTPVGPNRELMRREFLTVASDYGLDPKTVDQHFPA
ncbi:hypothetical protein [Methylobacterium sp. WL120]|uniref:hypothetical protein n=1 Tax=Methylobacterium sp. WL120 TaxID=2603887 RepID=UPI0011C9B05C|nr:hypothetical protein [Methylobacterium sp. WL120]TXM69667.1 hypothetical protein FV229_04800 [Methylobacterium sp. WL120]